MTSIFYVVLRVLYAEPFPRKTMCIVEFIFDRYEIQFRPPQLHLIEIESVVSEVK
jgi:hypothetical protein